MPTYDPANHEVVSMMMDVMEKYHQPLFRAEVTISLLMARGKRNDDGDLTSYAISKGGVRSAGRAKIVNLEKRAGGHPDAIVLLDGDRWEDWESDRQKALIDHELNHFDLQWDDQVPDVWKTDDRGRPVLKIRPHDYEVGWFAAVAQRWGPASFEVDQASQLANNKGQLIFPWAAKAPRPDKTSDDGEIITNAFAALISVGHSEPYARKIIEKVTEGGAKFDSVNDLIDAVHNRVMEDATPDTIKLSGAKGKGKKSKAQLEREAEDKFNAKP